jgi:hypothetical protein
VPGRVAVAKRKNSPRILPLLVWESGVHPRSTASIFDEDQPYEIREAVRHGDWEYLASLLETGRHTPAFLAYAADIIRGKVRRTANRHQKFINYEYLSIASEVEYLQREKGYQIQEDAIKAIAHRRKIATRKVQRALRYRRTNDLIRGTLY